VHIGVQDKVYRIIEKEETKIINKKILKEKKQISIQANHRLFNLTSRKRKERMTVL
jgi:hypothetical protein